jgi:hypothetical protein
MRQRPRLEGGQSRLKSQLWSPTVSAADVNGDHKSCRTGMRDIQRNFGISRNFLIVRHDYAGGDQL